MIYTTFFAILTALSLTSATPVKRAEAFLIRAKGSPDNCLGVSGDLYNGVGLSNVACSEADVPNTSFKGKFEIARGNNANGIRLSGTNYCLDSGLPISFQGALKLWQCYPGTPQQTWYYTDDDHIALTGQNSCVDFAGNGCGRFACSPGRAACGPGLFSPTGQQWVLGSVSVPPPPPPTQEGRVLHPNGDTSKCVYGGNIKEAAPGVAPFIEACASAGPNFSLQYFNFQRGRGAIKLAGSYNLCLDYGTNPKNGDIARLQTCNGGSSQDFYYTDAGDDHIAITGGSLCLDLRREDGRTLQFWQCGSNPQQKFTL